MEALEWIVQVGLFQDAMSDGIKSHVHTVGEESVIVLHLVAIHSLRVVGAVETLIHAVCMNAPQIINALMDVAIVVVLRSNGGGDQPENNILCFELEDRYKSYYEIDSFLTQAYTYVNA